MIINITYPDGTQDQMGSETVVCLTDIPDTLFDLMIESFKIVLVTNTTMRWNDASGIMRYKRETELKEA